MTDDLQMEDPFVLRKALDVTRRQLWDLQTKLNDIDEDGSSIILSQLHSQVVICLLILQITFESTSCHVREKNWTF